MTEAVAANYINRYAELHKEALDYLESQRNYGEKTNWARDEKAIIPRRASSR